MSYFALSLLFLSPMIGYATLILLEESKDPLKGFHDNFQKEIEVESISVEQIEFERQRTRRKRYVLISFILSISLLILLSAAASTLILIIAIFITFWIWERGALDRAKKQDLIRVEEEFPAIVELFAVLVSAGESPSTALLRVSQKSSGSLAAKFNVALSKMRSGKNLTEALESLGREVESHSVRRFCDTLILAIERGTSLSEVLTRQVEEVRIAHHAALLTAAGKAEIGLMLPVVFLILPISVLFALWPSYISLGQSVM